MMGAAAVDLIEIGKLLRGGVARIEVSEPLGGRGELGVIAGWIGEIGGDGFPHFRFVQDIENAGFAGAGDEL